MQVLAAAILSHTIRQGEKAICLQNTACDPHVIVTARATILEIVKHVKCIKEVAAKDVTRTVPCMGPRRILAATATHPSSQPRLTGAPRETVSKMAQDLSVKEMRQVVGNFPFHTPVLSHYFRSCFQPSITKQAKWCSGMVRAAMTINLS